MSPVNFLRLRIRPRDPRRLPLPPLRDSELTHRTLDPRDETAADESAVAADDDDPPPSKPPAPRGNRPKSDWERVRRGTGDGGGAIDGSKALPVDALRWRRPTGGWPGASGP